MLEMKPSKNRFCNYLDEDAIDEDILKAQISGFAHVGAYLLSQILEPLEKMVAIEF